MHSIDHKNYRDTRFTCFQPLLLFFSHNLRDDSRTTMSLCIKFTAMLNNNVYGTSARQTGAHESVSFKDFCNQVGHQHVTVLVDSYGYIERSAFSSHFELFHSKRQFTFVLDWFKDDFWLCHVGRGGNSWLNFECEEDELFYQDENGEWRCVDPTLFTRPSYDE